tara:strand:+ start:197 stop:343 length:147 start_codon:yes stop_codon:yes gene_type:complete
VFRTTKEPRDDDAKGGFQLEEGEGLWGFRGEGYIVYHVASDREFALLV